MGTGMSSTGWGVLAAKGGGTREGLADLCSQRPAMGPVSREAGTQKGPSWVQGIQIIPDSHWHQCLLGGRAP